MFDLVLDDDLDYNLDVDGDIDFDPPLTCTLIATRQREVAVGVREQDGVGRRASAQQPTASRACTRSPERSGLR
jgi:hypothetical protein